MHLLKFIIMILLDNKYLLFAKKDKLYEIKYDEKEEIKNYIEPEINYSEDDESPSKTTGGGQQQPVAQQQPEKDPGKIKLNNQKPDKKKEKKGFC